MQLGNQATKWVVYVSRLTKHLAKTLLWKFLYLTKTMLCWLLYQPLIRKRQRDSALLIRLCTDPCYEFHSRVSERRWDRDTLWCRYQCQHQLRCSCGSSTCRSIYWHNPETCIQRWHSQCVLAESSGLLGCWHHANGCAVRTKTVLHPKRSESCTTLTIRTSDLILYSVFQFYGIWHCFTGQVVLLDCLTMKMKEQWFSGASGTAHPTTCHIPADLNTQHYSSGISLTFVRLLWKP